MTSTTTRLRETRHVVGVRRFGASGGRAYCSCGHEFKRRLEFEAAYEDRDLHALDMFALGAAVERRREQF